MKRLALVSMKWDDLQQRRLNVVEVARLDRARLDLDLRWQQRACLTFAFTSISERGGRLRQFGALTLDNPRLSRIVCSPAQEAQMIGVLVRFRYGAQFNEAKIRQVAEAV